MTLCYGKAHRTLQQKARTLKNINLKKSHWRMQNGTATLQDSMSVSYKTNDTLTIRSRSCTFWYLLKWVKIMSIQKPEHSCS